jgi:serine/threonine protein kinase
LLKHGLPCHLLSVCFPNRDIKPEHLMIHNGSLKVGDFGSAGCASLAAATLASTLQKQALAAARKRQQLQAAAADGQPAEVVDQQQLLLELEALQHTNQLHLQADCTAEAAVVPGDACAQQQQHSHTMPARFGVAGDSVSGVLSPSVSGRLSVQAVKDAMNFRIGSIEYMAPEMLNKPTAAEVFHLVSYYCLWAHGMIPSSVKQQINRDTQDQYEQAHVVTCLALVGLLTLAAFGSGSWQ